ncbi:hypothetical protein PUN4_220023 [Paraburkholderia unamae]|nr:hypothetical protein PUN4_220023 [Paraburkholderia unamae]
MMRSAAVSCPGRAAVRAPGFFTCGHDPHAPGRSAAGSIIVVCGAVSAPQTVHQGLSQSCHVSRFFTGFMR